MAVAIDSGTGPNTLVVVFRQRSAGLKQRLISHAPLNVALHLHQAQVCASAVFRSSLVTFLRKFCLPFCPSYPGAVLPCKLSFTFVPKQQMISRSQLEARTQQRMGDELLTDGDV